MGRLDSTNNVFYLHEVKIYIIRIRQKRKVTRDKNKFISHTLYFW